MHSTLAQGDGLSPTTTTTPTSTPTLSSSSGAAANAAGGDCTWTEPYHDPFLNPLTEFVYESTTTIPISVDCQGCNYITSSSLYEGNGGVSLCLPHRLRTGYS